MSGTEIYIRRELSNRTKRANLYQGYECHQTQLLDFFHQAQE